MQVNAYVNIPRTPDQWVLVAVVLSALLTLIATSVLTRGHRTAARVSAWHALSLVLVIVARLSGHPLLGLVFAVLSLLLAVTALVLVVRDVRRSTDGDGVAGQRFT